MIEQSSGYPMFVYIYNAQGRYGEPVRVNNVQQLEDQFISNIKSAVQAGLEVRITDLDDCLVFHAENGLILFDGRIHLGQTMEAN